MKRIFGYDVDLPTFKKYNHDSYTIGFGFYDLAGVERWATDPERVAKFPDRAKEARQIMERIISEITGKDDQKMKNPKTAADYIAALIDIYTETRSQYTALNDSVAKAKEQLERAQEKAKGGDSIAQARLEVARADLREAQDACRPEYWKMMNGYNDRVAKLRSEFNEFLNDLYAADPDRLDPATMSLLNTGILRPSELPRLVERHKDTPVMLRVLGAHAQKMREAEGKHISKDDRKSLYFVIGAAAAATDGSRELQIFDSAVSSAAYGLGQNVDDYTHATRMHSYVTGWMEDFKNQIANLPLTPDGDQTGGDDE